MPDTTEELNRKLAESRGFVVVWKVIRRKDKAVRLFHGRFPSGHHGYIPNFTKSLDHCLKWLILPWVIGIDFVWGDETHETTICRVWYGIYAELGQYRQQVKQDFYEAEGETPALALCLALEKSID